MMNIRRLYLRWQRLGYPPKGLTASAILMAASERDYRPRPEDEQHPNRA